MYCAHCCVMDVCFKKINKKDSTDPQAIQEGTFGQAQVLVCCRFMSICPSTLS